MSDSGKHRRFTVYMNQGEIDAYFSKDVEFDWLFEEKYEPPFPLTPAEEKLVSLNAPSPQVVVELQTELYLLAEERSKNLADTAAWVKFETQALVNAERTRANLAVKLDQDIIHGPNRKVWPSDSDAVLYNNSDGFEEILAGYPAKIKYYLLKLKSYDYHYIYSVDDNIIMTPEEYLSRFL